jgi:hypothetical protein
MNTLFTAYKKRKDKSTEEFDEVFAEIIPDAYEDGSRHNKELADYINSVLKRKRIDKGPIYGDLFETWVHQELNAYAAAGTRKTCSVNPGPG